MNVSSMRGKKAVEKSTIVEVDGNKGAEKMLQAYDMAIEALKAEPVCEHFYKGYCGRFEDGCFRQCQAEPKHGEWVAAHIGETTSWYVECSKCHVIMPPVNYTYCPNCGAKMDKK